MYFIELFENHTEYENFASGGTMELPNVSHCIQENEVHYNPIPDPYNGHEYVDLGLPSGTKWATINVGANSPTDTGRYFSWGGTEGYTASQVGTDKQFTWSDYELSNGSVSTLTKYTRYDGLTVLEDEDDAAHVNWGGEWNMPTKEQCEELFNTTYVTNARVTDYNGSGVDGRLFTSVNNGNTMFLPYVGYAENGNIKNVNGNGSYWSSSIGEYDTVGTGFYAVGTIGYTSNRYCGHCIRGVVGQMGEITDDTTIDY